jgi:hypothetical protein
LRHAQAKLRPAPLCARFRTICDRISRQHGGRAIQGAASDVERNDPSPRTLLPSWYVKRPAIRSTRLHR